MQRYCIDEILDKKVTYYSGQISSVQVTVTDEAGDISLDVLTEQEAINLGFVPPLYEGQVIEIDSGNTVDVSDTERQRAKALYSKLLKREGTR